MFYDVKYYFIPGAKIFLLCLIQSNEHLWIKKLKSSEKIGPLCLNEIEGLSLFGTLHQICLVKLKPVINVPRKFHQGSSG